MQGYGVCMEGRGVHSDPPDAPRRHDSKASAVLFQGGLCRSDDPNPTKPTGSVERERENIRR